MRNILLEYGLEIKSLTINKLLVIFSISLPLTTVLHFVKQYVYSDWEFLIYLFMLIMLDTLCGVILAVKKGKFNSERLSKFFLKLALYCIVLIAVHVIINFKVNGEHPPFLGWFDDFVFSAMIAREGVSIFEKIALLYPGLFPKWLLKKLEYFDNTGNLPTNDQP
jgi:phage-related holin